MPPKKQKLTSPPTEIATAQFVNQNCSSTNNPVVLSKLNAYTRFLSNCTDNITDIYPTDYLPLLNINSEEPGNIHPGLKAPISIVKVRNNAWATLSRGLEFYAEPLPVGNPPTGIYKTFLGTIQIIIQANQGTLRYTAVNETFDICKLKDVFLNAQEDEGEDDDEKLVNDDDDDDDEESKKKSKGITRDTLKDTNKDLKQLDEAIFKIISILFLLIKINPYDQTGWSFKARNILFGFIVVSSEKEYLDTGQLYAICKPTIEDNERNGFSSEEILRRCTEYLSGEEIPAEYTTPDTVNINPRKPMLETIDGAATRIAANEYFTSYCKFMLKDTPLTGAIQLDASFYIDNKNLFVLAIFFSSDMDIQNKINRFMTREIMAKITRIRNIFPLCKSSMKIELCYYILHDRDILNILRNVEQFITSFSSQQKLALMMDNELYFMASTACFLYKYYTEKANNVDIVENLIKCNFDSLCHDNADSKIYRLVMILIFIIKNDTGLMEKNLKEMFPKYYTVADGASQLDREVSAYRMFSINIFDNKFEQNPSNSISYYINEYIFKCLDERQIKIFKILSVNNAHTIEEGLYRRLLNKSCYVFPVLHVPFMVVVSCKNSAHEAFRPAQQLVNSNDMFKLKSLDLGAIIPHYTNCAIDAPLKHGLSLSNYDISSLDSNVWVTAVTRNDAASQNMSRSIEYELPICMSINIANLFASQGTNLEFIYQFIYGNTVKSISSQYKITCPDSITGDTTLCNNFKDINTIIEKTRFFYKKRGNGPFRDIIQQAVKTLFINLDNDTEIPDKPTRDEFRDKLSRLFELSICGQAQKKDPDSKCSTRKLTEEKMIEGKTKFLKYYVDYMNNPENTIENKKKLTFYTTTLLEFTREKKNLDDLINNLRAYIPEEEAGSNPNPIIPETENRGTKRRRGMTGGYVSALPPQNQNVFNLGLYTQPKLEPKKMVYTKAKGVPASTSTNITISYTLPSHLKLSYASVFGKYGFYMDTNEDGEYELVILNTEQEYNNYKNKFQIDSVIQPTRQSTIQPTNELGGKRKTKKIKNSSLKTRKIIKKQKNRRYTRIKNIRNKRKTRKY